MNEQNLNWLLLREIVEVSEGIDRKQELSNDDEMQPLIDQIDAEYEGDQDLEYQAHKAEELVEPSAKGVDSETGKLFEGILPVRIVMEKL